MARSKALTESISIAEYHDLVNSGGETLNKFGAKGVWLCLRCDGPASQDRCLSCGSVKTRRFDSKAEASRYHELRLQLRLKEITKLRCQPEFPLTVNGVRVGRYYADFQYVNSDGEAVVEDVKGGKATDTPISKLKRKLVHAIYGIQVQVVTR